MLTVSEHFQFGSAQFPFTVLPAPDPSRTVANVRPGTGKVVAKVTFTNAAIQWAIMDGDRATLLRLGPMVPGA